MSMKLWGYYAFHTFINSIKKMFRSTFVMIVVIIIAVGFIFGFSAGLITDLLIEDESYEDITEREGYGDPEYGMFDENGTFLFYDDLYEEGLGGYDEEGNFIYYEDALEQGLGYYDEQGDFIFYYSEMTQEDIAMLMQAVEAGVLVLVLVMLFFGAHSGTKKGSDIFTMADVNFLFTAPMKPQSVLLFRLTFQMLTTFAGSIYLIFQIPNLVLNAGVPLVTCLLVFLAFVILCIFQKLFSVGMYTITATYEKTQKFVTPIMIGIGVVIVGVVGLVFLANDMDVWSTLELTLASEWSRLIPIVGWMKGFVVHAIYGNMPMVLLYLVLNILGMVALVYFIWHMKADFYEDAMSGAQAREDLIIAASENRKPVEIKADGTVKKDKRKVDEKHAGIFGKYNGASMFLAKELLVRKRLAKFGIVTTTMMWYTVISAGVALLLNQLMDDADFTIIGVILMAVLFFRNYGNPIAQETSMNWLFLVPESPYKKVLFAMLAGSYATTMDLLPGMMIAMLVLELNPAVMLLWLVTLITMDFMLSGVGMMLEALFPATAMDTIKVSIQMLLKMLMILVIVIVIVVGTLLGGFELGLVLTLIMNIVIGGVAFMIYPSILHSGIA